ncbi:nickel-dependent lactate racemase [Candidatus Bathyarchaeota archaeon]|nr:nickel-dependent lactate racemase [Candidatus Bathyarchaeota archaeon]
MVEVWLPYGRTEVSMRVPDENFQRTVEPKDGNPVEDPALEVELALQNPVGSKPVSSMVGPDDKVVLVVDDATRPRPAHPIIPQVVEELIHSGVRSENIALLIGLGLHKAPSGEEIEQITGTASATGLKISSHDCKSNLTHVGDTTHGTNVFLSKTFVEADVKILTGDIELHHFAGYGGGRKSVLPGISAEETILQNHALSLHPKARAGVLEGNPVNEDMMEAAEMAKVDFIVNVVLNQKKDIVKTFSGDLRQAFLKGTQTIDKLCKIRCESKADIVVVSPGGNPRDLNLSQALKAVYQTLDIVKEGGAMVLVAECPEGEGSQAFGEWMMRSEGSRQIEHAIKKRFSIGAHDAYYLTKALEKAKIYLVSTIPDHYVSSIFKMRPSRTANAAIQTALRSVGKDSKVTVIPYGAFTLPIVQEYSTAEPTHS